MRWNPPEGKHVKYDPPPPWKDDKSQCPSPDCDGKVSRMLPGTRALASEIENRFKPRKIGGYCCRKNTANESQTSVHGTGRAMDVYPFSRGINPFAEGDEIANWAVANAEQYGIQFVIWNGSFWGAGKSGIYNGPDPHTDHVHIEQNEDGARQSLIDKLPSLASESSADLGKLFLIAIIAYALSHGGGIGKVSI